MRFFLLVLLLFSPCLYAKSSIDSKINTTNKKLKKFDKTYSKVDKNLAKTAKAIIKEERNILRQERKLQKLQLELSLKEERYQDNAQELHHLKSSQNVLQKHQTKLQEDLVFMLAKNVSLSILLDDEKAKSKEALITEEIFEALKKITRENISVLKGSYSSNTHKITNIQRKIKKLKKAINEIDKKKKEVVQITKNKKGKLRQLKKQKNNYRASVKKLLKQQYSLKNELSKLNIIKEDAKAKAIARKKEVARLALLQRQNNNRAKPTNNLPKVKSRTDAYTSVKTKRYRGKKTIAPLDDFTIVKRFGPYEDPIYHIKIFNESISLKPKTTNAKVKNVLNGKVILAKKTSLLNNIVIIEHANGMHTIYAHLDKVAPTIKKGKRLKKGSIIGRVNDELMFEVTQKNYHINPLQLIANR
ncbi:peptidoglycan DD-metalloendopeptidase family protein [Sulfurimonas sp. MAG313]|nr:M23 family metallopeptidase [Sulfurimonas sp. MAG313]MDF1882246.1 peptidoglycan DD-metalloendopeptidase family protein [Sulfurimonas sp. MAG313]